MKNRKPLKCRNPLCRKPTAETDGLDLYFDGKIVPFNPLSIGFQCVHCKSPQLWESLERKKMLSKAQQLVL